MIVKIPIYMELEEKLKPSEVSELVGLIQIQLTDEIKDHCYGKQTYRITITNGNIFFEDKPKRLELKVLTPREMYQKIHQIK